MTENLIAVIVGGLIAIVAGVVGPIVQHFLMHQKSEEERVRMEMRELVACAAELKTWVDASVQHKLFDGPEPSPVSPMFRIEGLVLTSFPDVEAELAVAEAAIAKLNVLGGCAPEGYSRRQ